MPKKKYLKSRPNIPIATQRAIKIEAGHACLICKERVSLILHHIDGNRENNNSDNIVYVCSNCHGMIHDNKILVPELKIYKQKAQEQDQELTKLQQAVEYLTGSKEISVSGNYGQLKIKYQKLLNEYGDKLIFYQCFIYLIPGFYIDQRGKDIRNVVRNLLVINPREERIILEHLEDLNLIRITGGLISLVSKDDAKVALSELITSKKIDIDKIVEKFISL